MAAPKPKAQILKRATPSPKSLSQPATPVTQGAPATPAGSAQDEDIAERPQKRGKKIPKDQATLTPLDKGRDLAEKLLKKKSDASKLALTLQPLDYADALRKEMEKRARLFEYFSCTRITRVML